jgi:hypothetical protein
MLVRRRRQKSTKLLLWFLFQQTQAITLKTAARRPLIVKDDIEQRTMHLKPAALAVVNEAKLSEPVHEEAHPRPGRADHLGERLLTDVGDNRFGRAFLAEMSQQ